MSAELAEHAVSLAAAASAAEEDFEHPALQQPHLGRVATRRPSNPNLGLGDHGAIFSSAPSLRPDVPRTPGMRQMASQPAVSTGYPAAECLAAAASAAEEDFEHLALQQPLLGRVATRRPSNPNLGLGDHGAIFSSAPSLRPDVPRTPGMRQMASQPAVSTGHPAAETLGLSRGHQSHGHTRTASRLLGRASYA